MEYTHSVAAPSGERHVVASHGDARPGPGQYVVIWAALAVLIACEVSLFYIGPPVKILIAGLLVLLAIKFTLLTAYFMHLKFDAPLLRRVFALALVLACCAFAVALFTLHLLFHP